MAAQNIQLAEPENFASGDTLEFERYLADYLPTDGWNLRYTLTDLNGQKVGEVDSVVSTSNPSRHRIYQQNFAQLPDGDFILVGEALNTNGDRKRIYQQVLTLSPNLADGLASGPVLSENELALRDAYTSRRGLIKRKFAETDVQRSRFVLQKISEVNGIINELEEKVIWERRAARASNGHPDGSITAPVLRIFN